jgi:hypothetical protein
MGRFCVGVLGIALTAGCACSSAAQSPAGTVPETSVGIVLRNLAARAGVVFVGQVVRIEHETGTVEVVFQVDQPVLGAVGATYTLREWNGLWSGGQQRFRLGERAMLFLHRPKGQAAGLGSPVDGMEGVVPVVVQGANAAALLDVRWLAARVRRPLGAPIADAADGAIALSDATALVQQWQQNDWVEPLPRPLPAGVVQATVASSPRGVRGTVDAAHPGGQNALR